MSHTKINICIIMIVVFLCLDMHCPSVGHEAPSAVCSCNEYTHVGAPTHGSTPNDTERPGLPGDPLHQEDAGMWRHRFSSVYYMLWNQTIKFLGEVEFGTQYMLGYCLDECSRHYLFSQKKCSHTIGPQQVLFQVIQSKYQKKINQSNIFWNKYM